MLYIGFNRLCQCEHRMHRAFHSTWIRLQPIKSTFTELRESKIEILNCPWEINNNIEC